MSNHTRTEHTLAMLALTTLAALLAMLGALAATGTSALAAGAAVPLAELGGESNSALPDQRAYELVSPPSEGEPYLPPTPNSTGAGATGFTASLPFRVAASGDAVAWVGEPALSVGTGETGSGEGNEWLSTRSPEGWKSSDITPTGSREAAFMSFSSDLGTAIVKSFSYSPLTSEVPMGCSALYSRASESGTLSVLFSSAGQCGSPLFAGSSEDGSQIIFQDEAALTSDAQEATEVPPGHNEEGHTGGELGQPCVFGCNLYDLINGQLRLVNLVEGNTVPNATFGGYAPQENALTTFSHAISNDGSRVFWTDTQPGPNMEHVYVLENGTSTVPVSGAGAAEYWTATPDGRYAFYTENGELWKFDTSSNTRKALAGEGAGVQGVIGVNETGADGAYLYFVADAVLAGNKNAHGDGATLGEPNLYLLHEGTPVFIATLALQDNSLKASSGGGSTAEKSGDWVANVGQHVAQVTPDGRHLVFQSVRSLTGYDNTYQASPEPEVFVYSAEGGRLACASCDPTGAAPTIEEAPGASKLPDSTVNASTYARRLISENGGRVFYVSSQALAPQDTNGIPDVYEWEREGEGSCAPRTPARADAGCVFLLSGGDSLFASYLVESDATGENVFFDHVGRLGQVQAPVDHMLLYDARVDGGFLASSQACAGSACAVVPPVPPAYVAPPSVSFSGPGNFPPSTSSGVVVRSLTRSQRLASALKACKRDKRKSRRQACERQARKRYGAKQARKATTATRIGNERRAQS